MVSVVRPSYVALDLDALVLCYLSMSSMNGVHVKREKWTINPKCTVQSHIVSIIWLWHCAPKHQVAWDRSEWPSPARRVFPAILCSVLNLKSTNYNGDKYPTTVYEEEVSTLIFIMRPSLTLMFGEL